MGVTAASSPSEAFQPLPDAAAGAAGEADPPRAAPLVLVANPSGRGAEALREVEDVLRARGARFEVRGTSGPGDAARIAAAAAGEGAEVIAAIGGDGTLHEVVNGVLQGARERPPRLGLIPVGTGNDYARMLGLAQASPAEAARLLLEGEPWAVNVGRLEGGDRGPEYFCNNVGLAFMGVANAARERARLLPGRLSYSLGGVAAYIGYRADLLTLELDDVTLQGRFMLVHLGIGRYCGGGICLTPDARLDDDALHVAVVAERSKLKGFLQWPLMAAGKKLDDMSVLRARRVRVHGPRGMVIHADGEIRTVPTGVLEATLLPRRIEVLHR